MEVETLNVLKAIRDILSMMLFLKMIGIGIKCFDKVFGTNIF